jgi:drug/metabolite transporter (DMT)-like permease
MCIRRPMAHGVLLALASAVAFGSTIPLVSWAGRGVGPFSTASLLYLGAAGAALAQHTLFGDRGLRPSTRHVPWLLLMVLSGAIAAPLLFAFGLQRTGPITAGLLLNFEMVFTVLLARWLFRERLGLRVGVAFLLMVLGGLSLSFEALREFNFNALGGAAVLGATLAWAVDNTVSRRLSEVAPLQLVAAKGGLGGCATLLFAVVLRETTPEFWRLAMLLFAGATGYGLSLRLYLLAQGRIGAARTASVFALAPFFGAGLGAVVARQTLGWPTVAAAGFFALGVALHALERHAHWHHHEALVHSHEHRHDDGHHLHSHEGLAVQHSHMHQPRTPEA